MRPLVIAYVFGRMRYAPTVDCCNLPLPMGRRFRSLQFVAPGGRTFSQPAICRSQREDGFAACNLLLPAGGRFRSLQFAAPDGRTVSQLAICRSRREDSFAACNLPLPTGGQFRSLQFRKVSTIGGFDNISAGKIGFGRKIFCFAVGLSGKNKSAGAGNGAAADSV